MTTREMFEGIMRHYLTHPRSLTGDLIGVSAIVAIPTLILILPGVM